MATTTAEVTTLTAEVRVLMVGSRQVTLSVYRQLDRVGPSDMTAFGRVRDSQDDPARLWVVGVDGDGTLVRSSTWRNPLTDPEVGWPGDEGSAEREAFRHLVAHQRHAHPSTEVRNASSVVIARSARGTPIYWTYGNLPAIYPHDEAGCSEDSESWRRAAAYQVAILDMHEDVLHRWEDLPLIVLAGLR